MKAAWIPSTHDDEEGGHGEDQSDQDLHPGTLSEMVPDEGEGGSHDGAGHHGEGAGQQEGGQHPEIPGLGVGARGVGTARGIDGGGGHGRGPDPAGGERRAAGCAKLHTAGGWIKGHRGGGGGTARRGWRRRWVERQLDSPSSVRRPASTGVPSGGVEAPAECG